MSCGLVCRRWKNYFSEEYWKEQCEKLWTDLLTTATFTIEEKIVHSFSLDEGRLGNSWVQWVYFFCFSTIDTQENCITLQLGEKCGMMISGVGVIIETHNMLYRIGSIAKYVGHRTTGYSLFTTYNWANMNYIHQYPGHKPDGYGVATSLSSGVIHDGTWEDGRITFATIRYPDGTTYESICNCGGVPLKEIRHPKILESIEQKRCTNIDGMPQKMYRRLNIIWNCEPCARNCMQNDSFNEDYLLWEINPPMCQCSCVEGRNFSL